MDTQQVEAMKVELTRWRAFGRRLGYLRSHMAAGEASMLDALNANQRVFEGLDRYVDQLAEN